MEVASGQDEDHGQAHQPLWSTLKADKKICFSTCSDQATREIFTFCALEVSNSRFVGLFGSTKACNTFHSNNLVVRMTRVPKIANEIHETPINF